MDNLTLTASTREQMGKKVKEIRRNGKIPLVVYGHGTESLSLTADAKQLTEIFDTAGSSQLVNLVIDEKQPVKVLFQDAQIHPVSGNILHADLYQVKMTEKLETEIPLTFIGESPAVKDLEGNLITEKDVLEIKCLPADLVPEFEVDISVLKTFDDVIKVSDVKVPSTIEILNDPEEVVALVTPPRSEEELEAELAEPVDEASAIAEMEAASEAEKAEGEEGEESESQADEKNE